MTVARSRNQSAESPFARRKARLRNAT